jgi:hypothetical protein
MREEERKIMLKLKEEEDIKKNSR